jgi:WD40 repeat protein/predicted Ser/Thr protein kinase
MADDRRERAWAVFDQLAAVPADQREAVLRAACGDDVALRAEVEHLLALDDRLAPAEGQSDFLRSPLLRTPSPTKPAPGRSPPPQGKPLPPDHVGRYRVVRLLGEGGMGTVYEAEQDNPRRPVAMKVIRPGLVSTELIKHFEQEAQILGRLHHPGIAQIYDAGLAEDGRPFFAMEFIHGLPLGEFASRHQLDPAARLTLLARVCDAVQHAHDQGVIHRDLKPGNILVEESGQPKVLEFGVARAADLQTTASRTQSGQLLGTLSYMSPEQVTGDPQALDGRTDVYSLGVILFELLADRLPYNLHQLPLPEVARVIREREPSRLGLINSQFRGDVETIAAKALEKDKARRYQRPAALAADFRRYLNHEPILARPPSALYQFRKFARRNKGLVGGALGVFAALLAGAVAALLFAVRAEHNAQEARASERQATYETYRARLAAAVSALAEHDVAHAAAQLSAAPEAFRGWEWHHLRARLDDSVAVRPLVANNRHRLLVGPDGVRVGSPTAVGLHLTDENGGVTVLPAHNVYDFGQKPDGLWMMDQDADGGVRLCDQAGNVRLRLKKKSDAAIVAASPDQTRLAIYWVGKDVIEIEVYDTATGRRRAVCAGHTENINTLVFSPDGTHLASASDDGTARLWDAATGLALRTLTGHRAKVLSVAFRPDGSRILTSSSDGTVRQWDAQTGQPAEPPFERHISEVPVAVYSPDGQLVASGGNDRTVRLWRVDGREELAVLHGHAAAVIDLAFSADGRRLASTGHDDTVRFWETGPQAGLPVLRGHKLYVYPVAFSPDGRRLASGSWDKTVRLWDARTGAPGATLDHPGFVRTLAFGPDGFWLMTACDADNQLRIWDVATARLRRRFPVAAPIVWELVLSPDGSDVAVTVRTSLKFLLHVHDVTTGREVYTAAGKAFAYSPDGRLLTGCDADETAVVLWDAQTHRELARWPGHTAEINSVAFSRDGRRLVSASWDHTARVWDEATGECQHILKGHTNDVFASVFHPDGTRIASAGRDPPIWIWDAATGQEVARMRGHTNYVWSLAFSPDGWTLASGSGDGTVRLWDTFPLADRLGTAAVLR